MPTKIFYNAAGKILRAITSNSIDSLLLQEFPDAQHMYIPASASLNTEKYRVYNEQLIEKEFIILHVSKTPFFVNEYVTLWANNTQNLSVIINKNNYVIKPNEKLAITSPIPAKLQVHIKSDIYYGDSISLRAIENTTKEILHILSLPKK